MEQVTIRSVEIPTDADLKGPRIVKLDVVPRTDPGKRGGREPGGFSEPVVKRFQAQADTVGRGPFETSAADATNGCRSPG